MVVKVNIDVINFYDYLHHHYHIHNNHHNCNQTVDYHHMIQIYIRSKLSYRMNWNNLDYLEVEVWVEVKEEGVKEVELVEMMEGMKEVGIAEEVMEE